MTEFLGWVATAIVAVSYLSRNQKTLRRIQGLGACMWGVYGALIHSMPVVVANLLVTSMALITSLGAPAAEAAATKLES